MRAVVLVTVHAQAAGQGELIGQTPLVFGEQRPGPAGKLVEGSRRGKLVALITQVFVLVLTAEGRGVRVTVERRLGVEHSVLQLHLAAGVLDFLALQVAVGGDAFPAARVAHREMRTVVIVLRGRGTR